MQPTRLKRIGWEVDPQSHDIVSLHKASWQEVVGQDHDILNFPADFLLFYIFLSILFSSTPKWQV